MTLPAQRAAGPTFGNPQGLAAAWLAGWGVAWDADGQSLTIHLPTLLTAVGGAVAASWSVFARWGVR